MYKDISVGPGARPRTAYDALQTASGPSLQFFVLSLLSLPLLISVLLLSIFSFSLVVVKALEADVVGLLPVTTTLLCSSILF